MSSYFFQLEVTIDNVLEIIKNTSILTRPVLNLTEADIIYVADILYNYQLYGVVDETVTYVDYMCRISVCVSPVAVA